nr:reverse transcriptase domain-containing protein [Tanacetum cinerariifolium]
MTVIENEDNDLIPTRLVTDYQNLNDATRKDHFPIPFMDQMLKRLAGNEYYYFLDGFSGYFHILIDPQDQEKTTFIYPYGTFAYRRMPFGLCNAPGTFQRMTVIENEDNDLIPTRLVTNYQNLNDATRKDHFPIPFMDQMLKRLAGNEYYYFLDGFSGYFHILIDPQDQEKTTFIYPYGTFAYRRMPFGLCNAPGTFQSYRERGLPCSTKEKSEELCLLHTTSFVVITAPEDSESSPPLLPKVLADVPATGASWSSKRVLVTQANENASPKSRQGGGGDQGLLLPRLMRFDVLKFSGDNPDKWISGITGRELISVVFMSSYINEGSHDFVQPNAGEQMRLQAMVTGRLYQEVEGSLEEATWEWMSDSQSSYSSYHFEGKVIFEGVGNVMPWVVDGGRKKRVKCYAQGSGRRKRKKVIGRDSGSPDSTRILC